MRRTDLFLLFALAGTADLTVAASGAQAQEPRAAELSVSVRPARSMCFRDRIEVTGTLGARELVDVGPDREGMRVAQVLVAPLEEVASGQILARLARMDETGSGNPAAGAPVRAPVAGILVRSNAVVGMPASNRQGPLFGIVANGDIDLQAEVPVEDLAKLKVGQAVTVTPLGLPDMAAKVRQVEASTAPATQLGRVRIGLNPGQDLRIGTFARGIVVLGERCGIGVPYSAVSFEAEGTIVHVVNGERVEARPVETGLLSGENIEIRSGVSADDVVVVRAGAFVREGDRVNPITVKEAGAAGGR